MAKSPITNTAPADALAAADPVSGATALPSPGIAAPPEASDAAARGAVEFADGHVLPVGPVVGAPITALPLAGDLTEEQRRDFAYRACVELADERGAGGALLNGHIVILCGEPGFRRGGLAHPSRRTYPLDHFTERQLAAIDAEPKLEMVAVGGSPVPRSVFGGVPGEAAPARIDPQLAGRAAADAIDRPPNRAEPGLRNDAAAAPFRGRVGQY